MYIYTYMHVTTINEKRAMNLAERKERYMGRIEEKIKWVNDIK